MADRTRPLYNPRWWLPYARFQVRLGLSRKQTIERIASVTGPPHSGGRTTAEGQRFTGLIGERGFVIEPLGPHHSLSAAPLGIGEFLGPGQSALVRMTIRQDAVRCVSAIAVHLGMLAIAAALAWAAAWLAAAVIFVVAVSMWAVHVHDLHVAAVPITRFLNELGPVRM